MFNPAEAAGVNDKVLYWGDNWRELIDGFKASPIGARLSSPCLIAAEIFDELSENGKHKNSENIDLFVKRLSAHLRYDLGLSGATRRAFAFLCSELAGKRDTLTLHLARQASSDETKESYINQAISSLVSVLLNPNWDNEDEVKIAQTSQSLIVELYLRGYGLAAIKKIPNDLFSALNSTGRYLSTNFPLDIEPQEEDNEENVRSYNEAVASYFASLTLEKRLARISFYFDRAPERVTYLFKVEGLRGRGTFTLGEVEFYSPLDKQYLRDTRLSTREDEEFFGDAPDQSYMNGAVEVERLDSDEGRERAIAKLERALDLVRCYYQNRVRFEIAPERTLVVDAQGRKRGAAVSQSIRAGWFKWYESRELDQAAVANLSPISNAALVVPLVCGDHLRLDEVGKKISFASHWYRKGTESIRQEDKILNFWISIESLLNIPGLSGNLIQATDKKESKLSLAKEIISVAQLQLWVFNVGWFLYHEIRSLFFSMNGLFAPHEISSAVSEACQLTAVEGEQVDLRVFIANLPLLEDEIQRKALREKIIKVRSFYTDGTAAGKAIKERVEQVKDDIVQVYRLRNKIVHNAHYDPRLVSFYVDRANEYSGNLLRLVIGERIVHQKVRLEDIIIENYIEGSKLIDRITKGEAPAFLLNENLRSPGSSQNSDTMS